MGYVDLSYRFFGSLGRSLSTYFVDIKEDIHRANMKYTLEEYLSIAFFTVTITFVVEAVILSFTFGLFFDPFLAALLSVTLAMGISGILFFLFYSYPVTAARNRANKMKKTLPFVASYMATMTSARVPIYLVFKALGKFKEYGEIAKEARFIARDVEIFGMTTSTSIKKRAKRTPSKEFRELLWGINTVQASGGDLTSFLEDKSNELMSGYKRRIRKYAQDLSLYVEIYLTLIITGSIFFIVLSSVISTLAGGVGTILVQSFVVFILLPILSIGFIVLMKSISPIE